MILPKSTPDAASVARHYDALDRFYRELWGEHVHHGLWRTGRESPAEAAEALIALIADRLALRAGEQICDIGCGYGATARRLAREPGCRVTGLTLSAAQLAYAEQQHPGDNPVLIRRDWLANGLPDEAFDAAYSIESSEHMADKPRFFAEVARTLRPGGRFAVAAWLAREAPSAAAIHWLLEPICREGELPSLGSESEYRAMMAEAGLELVGFEDLTRAVARTWTICLGRALRALLTRREYRRFLLDPRNPDRRFALSLARIRIAYATGAMRYGLFTARRSVS